MAQTRLRSTKEIREEQLPPVPAFRAYWEGTALAGAGAPETALTLPSGMEVVEDVAADGSRLLVATG